MRRLALALLLIIITLTLQAQKIKVQPYDIETIVQMPNDEKKIIEGLNFFRQAYNFSSNKADTLLQQCMSVAYKFDRSDLIAQLLIARSGAELRAGRHATAIMLIDKTEKILHSLNDSVQTEIRSDLTVLYINVGDTTKGRLLLHQLSAVSRGSPDLGGKHILNLEKQAEAYGLLNDKAGLKTTFLKAIALAIATSNHKLLIKTKFAFADELLSVNATGDAINIFKGLIGDTSLSRHENMQVLSLLIINCIKINRLTNVETYYQRLRKLISPVDNQNLRDSSYWLAIGMYFELKNQYPHAETYYLQLANEFEKDHHSDLYLEGTVRLAGLYSKEFKINAANQYFKLVRQSFKGSNKYSPLGILYVHNLNDHNKRLKKADLLIGDLGTELADKDSLYKIQLQAVTNELEDKYKLLQNRQQLQLDSVNFKLNAITYSRNKQRSALVILALVLLVVSGAAASFILFQQRKQASQLHEAELVQLSQAHRTTIIEVLTEAQEGERRRIADQLHDEVGSMLSVARLNLSVTHTDGGHMVDLGQLDTANRILADVASIVRDISHQLMPVVVEKYGLKIAIEQLIADINSSGLISVECIISGIDQPGSLPVEFQVRFYRIVQELFQNILKHANATNAIFQLIKHPDSLNLYIEDNGQGLNADNDKSGQGISLLTTRVDYYNGKLNIEGMNGKGTVIIIDIPTQNIIATN